MFKDAGHDLAMARYKGKGRGKGKSNQRTSQLTHPGNRAGNRSHPDKSTTSTGAEDASGECLSNRVDSEIHNMDDMAWKKVDSDSEILPNSSAKYSEDDSADDEQDWTDDSEDERRKVQGVAYFVENLNSSGRESQDKEPSSDRDIFYDKQSFTVRALTKGPPGGSPPKRKKVKTKAKKRKKRRTVSRGGSVERERQKVQKLIRNSLSRQSGDRPEIETSPAAYTDRIDEMTALKAQLEPGKYNVYLRKIRPDAPQDPDSSPYIIIPRY